MAIQVKFKEVLGYMDFTENGNKYRVEICKSNVLAAFIYKGIENNVLWYFLADVQHAKNILKHNKGLFYENDKNTKMQIKSIVLNTHYKTELKELANIFKKANYSFEYIEF